MGKLILWREAWEQGSMDMFPLASAAPQAARERAVYAEHLQTLKERFERYFPRVADIEDYDCIRDPFHQEYSTEKLTMKEREECAELRVDRTLKLKFRTAATNPLPPNPTVRLVGSTNSCSGRVEIFLNGVWGTVCGDEWDLNDAHVVCGQLDCGRAVETKDAAHFGQGTGPILLDDLECSGNEISLEDCGHSGIGSSDCSHAEDAGVICEGKCACTQSTHTDSNVHIKV
ncbi:hypothetical protein JOQ06_014700 [Pogonophryne albipinna]|uniref:SRCR domain-containing protein n=1 Tax=Pogonophryne albipinna TaxID=1090488 RepID=A0AAD6AKS8_9TELE|nr:hypothetical protein JOQ06_014700 [Pogonophryne albipinna]